MHGWRDDVGVVARVGSPVQRREGAVGELEQLATGRDGDCRRRVVAVDELVRRGPFCAPLLDGVAGKGRVERVEGVGERVGGRERGPEGVDGEDAEEGDEVSMEQDGEQGEAKEDEGDPPEDEGAGHVLTVKQTKDERAGVLLSLAGAPR